MILNSILLFFPSEQERLCFLYIFTGFKIYNFLLNLFAKANKFTISTKAIKVD